MNANYSKEDILRIITEEDVEFIYLQFTDIFGVMKNVAITPETFEEAVNNGIIFDGSSIDGFVRIEESDMLLRPDYDTFCIYPWRGAFGREARLICDIYNPDGTPFEGDPRYRLKKACERAEELGYVMHAGAECEFFLFNTDESGKPTLLTQDDAGYFDLATNDAGENARKDMVITLRKMGFMVEASHHEVAQGQHEIDIKHDSALAAADRIMTMKTIIKMVAKNHGLYATFMPKPINDVPGSGMHINIYLYKDNDEDALYDEKDTLYGISKPGYSFLAGILEHTRGLCAITNPSINSYKRLNSGYEAPMYVTWSSSNRSPLVRIPARRGSRVRFELRNPDLSCNPYLALAVILEAGMDGMKRNAVPNPAIDKNMYEVSTEYKEKSHIIDLPKTLNEALVYLKDDEVVKNTLGSHIYNCFVDAKNHEWQEYRDTVTDWEIQKYLTKF